MEASHSAFGGNSLDVSGVAGVFLGPAWFIVCGLGAIMGGLLLRSSSFAVPMLMLGSGTSLLGILMLYRNVMTARRRRSTVADGSDARAVPQEPLHLPTSVQDSHPSTPRSPRVYSLLLEAPRPEPCRGQLDGKSAPLLFAPLLGGAVVLGVPDPMIPGPIPGMDSPHQKGSPQGQPQAQPLAATPPPSPASAGTAPPGHMVLVLQPHPELMGYSVTLLERRPVRKARGRSPRSCRRRHGAAPPGGRPASELPREGPPPAEAAAGQLPLERRLELWLQRHRLQQAEQQQDGRGYEELLQETHTGEALRGLEQGRHQQAASPVEQQPVTEGRENALQGSTGLGGNEPGPSARQQQGRHEERVHSLTAARNDGDEARHGPEREAGQRLPGPGREGPPAPEPADLMLPV